MNRNLNRCLAAMALGMAALTPALAQTTTVPSTGTSSPAARDAHGHAADSTAPMAQSKGTKPAGEAATGAGNSTGAPRSNTTPLNTTPGAGSRNSGNAVPPTSGAAGR